MTSKQGNVMIEVDLLSAVRYISVAYYVAVHVCGVASPKKSI
jgi:hypothetical protein